MAKRPGSAGDPLWYKGAIRYDLQDPGVTCPWLRPYIPSPLKDDGYDISGYMNLHSM